MELGLKFKSPYSAPQTRPAGERGREPMSERRHDYAQAGGSPRVTFPLPSLLSFFAACDSPHP